LITVTDKMQSMATTKQRATVQGSAVRSVLAEGAGFASAQDIHASLRQRGTPVGLSTVYRHLQSLVEQGVADVIQSPDGEATYRYCGETTSAHHHHLVCRKCGHTEEVTARAIERWAGEIASKFDFSDVDHTVEIFGTCAPCRKAAEKSAALRT
jgi:Fur family transcriptional regulator, ferric uptake regulator